MSIVLTVNELAHLTGVRQQTVEKAIEHKIVKPVKRPVLFAPSPARVLQEDAVCYFSTVGKMKMLKDAPVSRKRELVKVIRAGSRRGLTVVTLEEGLSLDLPSLAGPVLQDARSYFANKRKYLSSDPEILGGVPVIKGTRIPVDAIRGRLADGDTVEDLVEDYPDTPKEAFVVAHIYALTHPTRGRPVRGGKPWQQVMSKA